MNIDTLILELERVAELATDGDYFVMPGRKNMLNVCGGGAMIAMNVFHDNAAAICSRHNTAALVISELKSQRARADRFEARLTAARFIIIDLQLHLDPDPGQAASNAWDRAEKYLTETTP